MQRSFMRDQAEKTDTRIVHAGRDSDAYGGGVNPPVHHLSTVIYPSVEKLITRYDNITPDSRVMTYGRISQSEDQLHPTSKRVVANWQTRTKSCPKTFCLIPDAKSRQ